MCVKKVHEAEYTLRSRCCKPCLPLELTWSTPSLIKAFSCVPAPCVYPLHHNLCVFAPHSFSFPSLHLTEASNRIHSLISGTTGGSNTGSKGYTQAWLRGIILVLAAAIENIESRSWWLCCPCARRPRACRCLRLCRCKFLLQSFRARIKKTLLPGWRDFRWVQLWRNPGHQSWHGGQQGGSEKKSYLWHLTRFGVKRLEPSWARPTQSSSPAAMSSSAVDSTRWEKPAC